MRTFSPALTSIITLGLTEHDRIFSAPKLFFAYGLGNSLSFPLWAGSTAVLLEDRPTAQNTLAMIERFAPTLYFGVPTLYAAQVAAMEKDRPIRMTRTRLCLSGGEPLPPAVCERWKRLTGVDVLDGKCDRPSLAGPLQEGRYAANVCRDSS